MNKNAVSDQQVLVFTWVSAVSIQQDPLATIACVASACIFFRTALFRLQPETLPGASARGSSLGAHWRCLTTKAGLRAANCCVIQSCAGVSPGTRIQKCRDVEGWYQRCDLVP